MKQKIFFPRLPVPVRVCLEVVPWKLKSEGKGSENCFFESHSRATWLKKAILKFFLCAFAAQMTTSKHTLNIFKQYISRLIIGLLFFGFFWSCQNDSTTSTSKAPKISLPNTPEGVCRAWQQYLDNNEIAKAMLLGSPAARKWLKSNQDLFLADDELEPTQFIALTCTQQKEQAMCKYSIQEGEDIIEDFFTLLKVNGQWVIHIEDEQESSHPEEMLFEEMRKSLDLD